MNPEKPLSFKYFNSQWSIKYKWLYCDYIYEQSKKEWEEHLFCSYCLDYYKHLQNQFENKLIAKAPETNNLISGSKSIRLDRVYEHLQLKNKFHVDAEGFKFGLNQEEKEKDLVKIGFNKLFGNQKMKISNQLLLPLFQQSYWLAYENIAMLKYESLKQLVDLMNVEQNEAYNSRKFCEEFQESIYDVLLEEFLQNLQQSNFISISIDSTQIVKQQHIIAVSVRFLKDYQIQEQFLNLKLLKELDSQSYFDTLINTLAEYGLLKKLMFINTDGAAVVSSTKNGLIGKLQDKLPHLLSIKCIAHKVSLGIKDLATQFQQINSLNHQIFQICAYFKTKSRLDLLFENQQEFLDENNRFALTLHQPIDVRWVSYYPAIQRLLKLLVSVIAALQEIEDEDGNPIVSQIICYLQNIDNLLLIGMYGDLLKPIYKLSKQFQKQSISFSTVEMDFDYCINCLEELLEFDGELTVWIESQVSTINPNEGNNRMEFANRIQLKSEFQYKAHYKKMKKLQKQFIKQLIDNLEERFYFLPQIKHFDSLNIDKLKYMPLKELETFGVNSIKSILQFYKKNNYEIFQSFNESDIIEQYEFCKQRINQSKNTSNSEILKMLEESEMLKEIKYFFHLYYLIPVSSVECERIFSHVNLIVTKQRNMLSIESINRLIFISRNGISIENLAQFNFLKAIEIWKSEKKRRKL